jgi:hypothetical protein
LLFALLGRAAEQDTGGGIALLAGQLQGGEAAVVLQVLVGPGVEQEL